MIVARTKYRVPLGVAMLLLGLLFHVPTLDMEEMQRSTVRILCETKEDSEARSGFVVGTDRATYVVTNHHVAEYAKPGEKQDLSVLLPRGVLAPIYLVWADANKDPAIMRSTEPIGGPTVRLADTALVMPRATGTVVGFPRAADKVVRGQNCAVRSVSHGYVSRSIPGTSGVRYLQHTAATNPGNSEAQVYDEGATSLASID
jgi:S1-C subfamily serine protease